jgi:hypothetical protein
MTLADEARPGSESKRLTQFQLQGDAAERYERWAVPFITGPLVPPLLDLLDLRAGERVLDVAGEEAHAALIAHMKDATRAYVDGHGLAVPRKINVAIGRKKETS